MNFDLLAGAARWLGVLRLLGGLAAMALGLRAGGSVSGGLVWVAAFAIACTGYGIGFERLVRSRVSAAATTITGLAVLLLASNALGAAGVLTREMQLGLMAAGSVLNVVPRGPATSDAASPSILVVVVVPIAAVLVATPLVLLEVSLEDGFNHAFAIKRLWDTGNLFPVFHQAGSAVVGEAYGALANGAEAAQVYEHGACAALLVWSIATELRAGREAWRTACFAILVIPIALAASFNPEWSGTLFHVATLVALAGAFEQRSTGWRAIMLALALATVRHEYVVLAVPYIAAAIVLPHRDELTRRGYATALAVWIAILVPFQIALAVPPVRAVINAGIMLAAIPIAMVLVRASGRDNVRGHLAVANVRDPLALVCFATTSWAIAVAIDAIRPAQHGDAAVFTAGFAAIVWFCFVLVDPERAHVQAPRTNPDDATPTDATESPAMPARGPGLLTTTAVLAAFIAFAIWPVVNHKRGRLGQRWRRVLLTHEIDRAIGPHTAAASIRALQELVPAAARLGFWGTSAAELDFTRQRIRDISWPPGPHRLAYFLIPMTSASLSRIDYLIVENVPAQPTRDFWDTERGATTFVEGELELVGSNDGGQVFRVRR